ncbi:MAG: hypothetical protein WCS52_10210 [bacterium]
MQNILIRSWKPVAVVLLLIGIDLTVSLPIMGATYRPFQWMTLASTSTSVLYPVIQNLSFMGGKPFLTVQTTNGQTCVLQCNTNLKNSSGWVNVVTLTATGRVMHLTDTNPIPRSSAFYRITNSF